jgi:hypothetical protein
MEAVPVTLNRHLVIMVHRLGLEQPAIIPRATASAAASVEAVPATLNRHLAIMVHRLGLVQVGDSHPSVK